MKKQLPPLSLFYIRPISTFDGLIEPLSGDEKIVEKGDEMG